MDLEDPALSGLSSWARLAQSREACRQIIWICMAWCLFDLSGARIERCPQRWFVIVGKASSGWIGLQAESHDLPLSIPSQRAGRE